MRVARLVLSFLLIIASSPRVNSQQSVVTPQRDPQAVAAIQNALAAMGGAAAGSQSRQISSFSLVRNRAVVE